MDMNMDMNGVGGVIQKVKGKGLASAEKVCFVSRSIWKDDDDGDRYFKGCHIFVVDLSELADGDGDGVGVGVGVLEPTITLEYGFCDSICGLDSTLYFAHFANSSSSNSRNFYALDIPPAPTHQHLSKQKQASALRTLPLMRGRKRATLVTPIPATKKILVFSSSLGVHCWDPDRSSSSRLEEKEEEDEDEEEEEEEEEEDEDEEARVDFVDFEIYDTETNTWEKLPDLILRMQPTQSTTTSYFWHQSFTDKRGIQIAEGSDGLRISQYTFIHNDTVFLVQLNCGVKLTLNLNSPSKKVWELYNYDQGGNGTLLKPCTSHRNHHLYVVDQGPVKRSWCASDIGGDLRAFDNLVSFPLSSFYEDDRVKQRKTFSTLAPLEGDKGYVCIVQGGVSRKSKSRYGQVIMDVMDVKAKNQPQLVAARRFEVKHHYRTFWPFCMFAYHSN